MVFLMHQFGLWSTTKLVKATNLQMLKEPSRKPHFAHSAAQLTSGNGCKGKRTDIVKKYFLPCSNQKLQNAKPTDRIVMCAVPVLLIRLSALHR